jgi:hypothetical protein
MKTIEQIFSGQRKTLEQFQGVFLKEESIMGWQQRWQRQQRWRRQQHWQRQQR